MAPFRDFRALALVLALVLALATASGTASALERQSVIGARFDEAALGPTVTRQLHEDLRSIAALELDARDDAAFVRVFGGSGSAAVVRYLNERIHYFGRDTDRADAKDGTYAINYGPSFLTYAYERYALGKSDPRADVAKFRGAEIRLDSPRTGFVAIAKEYTAPGTSQIDRLDTLVHEARHSDCPAIPDAADLSSYDHGHYLAMSARGKSCTNVHMPCPKGHDLAGELACDDYAWGAYELGYIFSKAVEKTCRNCTEKQKQEALATATDDFSRLSKAVQHGLLDGTAPDPDMSSIQ